MATITGSGNEVSLKDYQLPAESSAESGNDPEQMVVNAFNAMSPWFSGLTNPIEIAYGQKINTGNDPRATFMGLGKLASKANDFMAQLAVYVNRDIQARPQVRCPQYKLPREATLKSGNNSGLMIAKAIQALVPWFRLCMDKFKPYYIKFAQVAKKQDSVTAPEQTQLRLIRLRNRINDEKTILQNHLNAEIAKKSGKSLGSAVKQDSDSLLALAAELVSSVLEVDALDESLDEFQKAADAELSQVPDTADISVNLTNPEIFWAA